MFRASEHLAPLLTLRVLLIILSVSCSYKEEANADKAIKALTSALAPKAKVLRDGKVEQIDAVGLVPGDKPKTCLGVCMSSISCKST